MFCALILPTRHYSLLFSGVDEDNDKSDILKCLLEGCAVLYVLYYLVPIRSLIGEIRYCFCPPFILKRGRLVKYLVRVHIAGK